jgi:hypothetical protein
MTSESDFFEDLALSMETWTATASKALTDQTADLMWVEKEEPYRKMWAALIQGGVSEHTVAEVMSECFRGFAVSFLTALDGGTALSEKGRLYLVNEMGSRLGSDDLHDGFVGHLFETGRVA